VSGYVLTPEANADLLGMWFYIAQDSEEIADRVHGEFYDTFEVLARMPGLGHRRSDYTNAKVLFFPLYSYLITYRPGTDPLQILAVVHGAREVERVLKERKI